MRFQSTLFSWLARARPGNVREQGEDALLNLPPTVLPTLQIPFPFTKTLGTTQTLPSGEDVQGSLCATRLDTMGTAVSVDPWIQIPPGVWKIDLEHAIQIAGAVSDLTALMDINLQIVDGGVTRNHLLSRLNGSQAIFQRNHRIFVIHVTKDIPTKLTTNPTVGLGTSLNVSRCSAMLFRLF